MRHGIADEFPTILCAPFTPRETTRRMHCDPHQEAERTSSLCPLVAIKRLAGRYFAFKIPAMVHGATRRMRSGVSDRTMCACRALRLPPPLVRASDNLATKSILAAAWRA